MGCGNIEIFEIIMETDFLLKKPSLKNYRMPGVIKFMQVLY